jgi:hypothetical protein
MKAKPRKANVSGLSSPSRFRLAAAWRPAGILPAEQVALGAPYQIPADDLQQERVAAAIGRTGRPYRIVPTNQLPMFPDT